MRTYEELEQLFGDGEQAFLVTTFPFSEEAALLYCNDAASVFFGEGREKITGRTLGELGEAWKKDKEIHHSVFDGDMCLCMIIDVADSRRRLEKEYQAYRKRMEEALEAANVASLAKTKFLSEMSHDIRTPMNAIMGMADIALNYAEDSGRVEDCLKKIQTASGHLLRLINEVLDMSRIESGKLVLVNEPFRLADLVHEIFIVIRPQAEKKEHRISSGAGGHSPRRACGRQNAHSADLYQSAFQRHQVHPGGRGRMDESVPEGDGGKEQPVSGGAGQRHRHVGGIRGAHL
ncbi:sensory/regulatory protein RpfC [Lachnospiraceae bacterium]|nr:sensory/regulatory protein RpfC [Lachnospiraceae bacterium]